MKYNILLPLQRKPWKKKFAHQVYANFFWFFDKDYAPEKIFGPICHFGPFWSIFPIFVFFLIFDFLVFQIFINVSEFSYNIHFKDDVKAFNLTTF